jgi:hypothetical protein
MTLGQRAGAIALVALLPLAIFALVTFAQGPADTDADGMSDAWEIFFSVNHADPEQGGMVYTNAADGALDYDGDGLVNSNEFLKNSDPFVADTDGDGFADAADSNAVSRAWFHWGEMFWIPDGTNYDVAYAQPSWVVGAFQADGEWLTNAPTAWHVADSASNDIGVLCLEVDRNVLTNDVVMRMGVLDHTNAFLYVDLYDINWVVVATNLFGNLLQGSGVLVTNYLIIPLSSNSQVVGILVRRGSGEVTIRDTMLYVDKDQDGLDADQESQCGTSDSNLDSDGDGLSDYEEVFVYHTDPANWDTDGEGLSDGAEVNVHHTNPLAADTDGDWLNDWFEVTYGLNPLSVACGDLVGLWSLDEGTGSVALDTSGHANDGQIQGAGYVDGFMGKGLEFDGSNDLVAIPNSAVYKPSALTVALRVTFSQLYGNAVSGDEDGTMVLVAEQNSGNGLAYAVYKTSRNSLVFELANPALGVTGRVETADDFVVTGRWYHVRAVFGQPDMKLYVNGELAGTTTHNAALDYSVSTGLKFGVGPDACQKRYFAGILDDVKIYKSALSESQIANLEDGFLDSDNDGLTALEEQAHGTDPRTSDTDGDGLGDADELAVYLTDPTDPDSDNDGMPDGWEIAHGFSPVNPADGGQDADSDGLTNAQEYQRGTDPAVSDTDGDGLPDGAEVNTYSTDPLKTDTDGDGLPDWWEVQKGTQPTVADAKFGLLDDPLNSPADPDHDFLANIEEYRAGTDPLDRDTDNDGVDDYVEVKLVCSDPLVADFDGSCTSVYQVSGAEVFLVQGSWGRWGSEVYSMGRRGYLSYTFNTSAENVYRLEVAGYAKRTAVSKINAYVDGYYVGRNLLVTTNNTTNFVHFFTPWLTNGEHEVGLYWDNVFDEPELHITSVRLQTVGGPDTNGNGVADWRDHRFGNTETVDSFCATSKVSPYCLEGNTHFLPMMTMSGGIIPIHGAGYRWYADVPLSAASNVASVISFQDGAKTVTSSVEWTAFNILTEPDVSIRVDDSLRLTAFPPGATGGAVTVQIVGVTNYATDVENPVIHQFTNAGTFTVIGSYSNETVNTDTVRVTVVSAFFSTNAPAAGWGRTRNIYCPDIQSSSVVVQGDLDSTIGNFGGAGTTRYFRYQVDDADEEHYLVARLGQNGPILDRTIVDAFWVQATVDGVYYLVETLADGSKVLENRLIAGYLPDSVTLRLQIFVGGGTFDDGTTQRDITVNDLSDEGEYIYRMIIPSSAYVPCHHIKAYQDETYIGSLW